MCQSKSILSNYLLAIACFSFFLSSSTGFSQSDDAATENDSSKKPAFVNPFSKMFSKKEDLSEEKSATATKSARTPSSSKPALSAPRTSKPAVNAIPASNRGGLLMPLKSFTNRVFRSGEDAIEQSLETVEEVENLYAKPTR